MKQKLEMIPLMPEARRQIEKDLQDSSVSDKEKLMMEIITRTGVFPSKLALLEFCEMLITDNGGSVSAALEAARSRSLEFVRTSLENGYQKVSLCYVKAPE